MTSTHYYRFTKVMLWLTCLYLARSAQAEPLTYAILGNLVLQSEPAIRSQGAIPSKWSQYDPQEPTVEEIDLTIKLPFKFEQERLAFLLLHTCVPITQAQVIDTDGIDALAIISKNSPTSRCLLDIFPTRTVFGKAITAKNLALPLSNFHALQKRQQAVKAFTHNQALQQQTQTILHTIAHHEPFMLSFFDASNKFTKKIFDTMYFKNNERNTSVFQLAALRAYQTMDTNPSFVFPRLIVNYLKGQAFIKVNRAIDYYLFDMKVDLKQSLDGEIKWYLFFIGGALLQTAVEYGIQKFKRPIVDEALVHMKTKVVAAAEFINCAQQLHEALVRDEALRAAMPEVNAAFLTFLHNESADFAKLREILATDTFKGKASYLDSARILAAYKLLEQQKELLTPLFEAIGEMDALSAAAALYMHANATHPHSYCFAHFSDKPEPTIALVDFINPLMTYQEAVINSVHLGSGGDHNLVITGPNGSGKSIFMKSIALNLVLAQAFGIAAAHTATITPFDTFHIYLNIQESLELSLSTFMAEKKKLDAICAQIGNQQPGHKSFTLIDEGLKGTVEQSGGPLIYQAGIKMSNNPGNICLLATHFKKPTELEEATHCKFTNCHLELLEPHEGVFERSFKLKREKIDWWFTNDAKRERFMIWLSDFALRTQD